MTSLLAPGARPLELALEAAMARAATIDARSIATLWSPEDCPAALLPYLAWGLSVDVWDPDWSEARQRQVCRDAIALHRLKTTPAGIRAHVALADATVTRFVRPPARGFLRGARTPEQLAAWLDRLPQLRIYPYRRRAVAVRRSFHAGPGARHQWSGVGHRRSNRGTELLGRRATLWRAGVETDVALRRDDDIDQFVMPGSAQPRAWQGVGYAGSGFATPSRALPRIVTVRPTNDASSYAIPIGLEPVDVRPVRVAVRRTPPAARAFHGRFGGFRMLSVGATLVYDRFSLHDTVALGARRRVFAWHGVGRMGMPAYTAEVRLSVPMHRPQSRRSAWHSHGFARAGDLSGLWRAIEAIGAAKARRDTILVDTTNYLPATFGKSLRFGEFSFGQLRKVT